MLYYVVFLMYIYNTASEAAKRPEVDVMVTSARVLQNATNTDFSFGSFFIPFNFAAKFFCALSSIYILQLRGAEGRIHFKHEKKIQIKILDDKKRIF